MILFRHRLSSLLLLALGFLMAGPAGAADDTSSGGTFNAPGYPARPTTQGGNTGAPAGAAPGSGPYYPGAPNAAFPPAQPGATVIDPRTGRPVPAQETQPQQRREPRPPPKPSEFQKFVEGATGRLLPIFGRLIMPLRSTVVR